MTERQFRDNVEKARKRVRQMDAIDGFKDRALRTILLALECGIRAPKTSGQFDAYVMLEDIANT